MAGMEELQELRDVDLFTAVAELGNRRLGHATPGSTGPRVGRSRPLIGRRSEVGGTRDGGLADAYAFRLAGGHEAGSAARAAVAACDGDLPSGVRGDVLLLVTELVTNAVRHAGVGPDGSLRVEFRLWPQRVRVDVTDPGIEFARIRPRSNGDGYGGWGLVLVDRIAARWGVERGMSGTCVWFEVDVER
jgi:anti-sigma regulatory factor (Ser/Thr protein kinase)